MDENGGSITPLDYGRCRWTRGCGKQATRSGYCKAHTSFMRRRRTVKSDGVLTGPTPKLTQSQYEQMRRLRSAFKTHVEIARIMGVTETTVGRYLRGEVQPRPDRIEWEPLG